MAVGLQLIFFAEIFLSFLRSMIVLTVYPSLNDTLAFNAKKKKKKKIEKNRKKQSKKNKINKMFKL